MGGGFPWQLEYPQKPGEDKDKKKEEKEGGT